MIKLALCSALCICSLMSAIELHSDRRIRAEAVRELGETVSRMISLLRFESADVYSICRQAFDDVKNFDSSGFTVIDSGDFPQKWREACENLDVDSEAKRLFEAVGSVLGSCDIESQTDRLTRLEGELYALARKLRERSDSTKRLYTVIGVLAGLGVSLVII